MIKPVLASMLKNDYRKQQRVDFLTLLSQTHMIQDFAKPIRGTHHSGKNRSGSSAKIMAITLIIVGLAAFGVYIHFIHGF